jgi:hypothetical protein
MGQVYQRREKMKTLERALTIGRVLGKEANG